MILDILAYTIVLLAFAITIYKSLQSFQIIGKKKTISSSCSSCSSSACGSCGLSSSLHSKPQFPIKVLHDEIKID